MGRTPATVDKSNESEVRLDQYRLRRKPKHDEDHRKQRILFDIGDQVRVSFRRETFDREYGQKWSGEVFIITERDRRNGIPIYKLRDWNGEPIKGTFYQQQLQKVDVSDEDAFKIDKVLKRRRVNGRNQVLVKWLNWPKKFNQWIDEDAIEEI